MHHRLLLLLTAISSILMFEMVKANAQYGFTVDLVHRHSPLSPFYNDSLVSSEILRKTAIHSMHQIEHLQSSIKDNFAKSVDVPSDQGFYLINLSFGTPLVQYFAIVDTTTGLLGYNEFRVLNICQALSGVQCFKTNDCQYNITYPEGSSTLGILSSDTLSIDSENGENIAFPMSIFGCGRNNQVNFGHIGFAGIVGLGGGPFSLVSQKGTQINYRFSDCFVLHSAKSSGKLIFGQESVTSRPSAVSTPLVPKTLKQAMVKDATVEKPVQDPSGTFNLCYGAGTNISVLEMVFHFTGADVRLRPINTFQVNGDLVGLYGDSSDQC
ncbi:hypothetical protein F3Y22_tig00110206pilonHSYRG00144 [Hibiscus syriacus]|uniref:Peptidase A1 domain-containing protein n=1 Tax=Hibiscus syriacus TaxID=106335 RepID=A0A6A3BC11_HIBSY|nr:hypothetical protein F3Y22_tig00110206pilonHSYRG00144 [Hibiscus syriacus]